jgi:hypothetical protein
MTFSPLSSSEQDHSSLMMRDSIRCVRAPCERRVNATTSTLEYVFKQFHYVTERVEHERTVKIPTGDGAGELCELSE